MGDEVVKQLSGTPDAFVAAVGIFVCYTLGLDDAIGAAFTDAVDALNNPPAL